jgi:imidazolonepropionase-like amidohydrolase
MIGRTPLPEKGMTGSIRDHERGDLIKIINSGPNSLSAFGKETSPQFTLEDLRDASAYGHSIGLKLMVHANGQLPVKQALEAGCDSIEHGYFMGKENLKRMAEKRTPWIPTVFAMESLCAVLRKTPEAETAARNVEHQLEQIRIAREQGVIVALGTDSGSLGVHHGKALIEELRLFMTAGMCLEEAVQCATSRNAALLGLRRVGSLYPGTRAVFVVTQGGPERLPDSLRSPEAVFVDGVAVIRRLYDQ